VLRTRVGYAGGTTPRPTYYSIGDHSESVEITFDPSLLSYERLLELFWEGHDPVAPVGSRQYASIIFYRNEEQRRLAEQSKAAEELRRGGPVPTEIAPAGLFTEAEGYHQKYYLQGSALMRAAGPVLSTTRDLVSSTLAARLNAAAAGLLSREQLEQDLRALGLDARAVQALLDALPGPR
jgi:peptide-methionine (S)-S-oxide reductase